MVSFLNGGGGNVASDKFFEEMIGKLYKANILMIKCVHKIHTFVC